MKGWARLYVHTLKISVENDLDKHPKMSEDLGSYKPHFVKWAANQRVLFEADIADEYKEYTEKFIKNRLYDINVKLWKEITSRVFIRDGFTCKYCGKIGGSLEADHAIPISRGGTNNIDNLVTSCRKCNRQKRNKTPDEFEKWRNGK